MNESRLQWRVGLFVLICLVLLAGLLLEFSKGLTLFHPTYEILLRAPTAGSLKVRAGVLMSGVQVGTAADIRLSPRGTNVTITLRIFNQYQIYKDARFVIEQSGFLGDEYVAIIPTKNEGDFFGPGKENIAEAEAPFNMQEVARSATGFLQRIDDTAQRLNETLVDVRRYLLNPETLTNLSLTAANLRNASDRAVALVGKLDELVSTNAPALSLTGTNLVRFADQLNNFASHLDAVLATNTPVINLAVRNAEASSEMLKSSMEDLQAGKGLAGALLKNKQIANDVANIAQNLSITSSNLNRLGLWGILWQHRPPKPPPPAEKPLASPKDPFKE